MPPALAPPEGPPSSLFPELVPDPFERQVTKTLASAISATRAAAMQAASTGSFEPFSSAVHCGVSANLCEALVGMAAGGGLEISLSWARTRTPPPEAIRRVDLQADTIPVIEEAARVFRATAGPEPSEVHGYVIRLYRPPTETRGEVTILDDTGERPRRVTVELDEPDYGTAVQAHKRCIPVLCCGDLAKEGGSFRLRNPHRFALVPED